MPDNDLPIHDLDASLAFASAYARFEVECHFIKGLILRYIRRNYARMVDERGACVPEKSSVWEVLDISGVKRNAAGDEFLNNVGFPELDDIEQQLNDVRAYIMRRVEATYAFGNPDIMMLEVLQKQFGLDDIDMQLLCAISASQISSEITRQYRFATGIETAVFPIRFYCELLENEHVSSNDILTHLMPDSAIRQHALVIVGEQYELGKMTPLLHAPVCVPDRITAFLHGKIIKSDIKYATYIETEAFESPISKDLKKNFLKLARRTKARIALYGLPGTGRSRLIEEFAHHAHLPLLRVHVHQLRANETVSGIERVARQWFREARLQNGIMHFDFGGDFPSQALEVLMQISDDLCSLIEQHPAAIFITASTPGHTISRLFGKHAELICHPPTQAEQPGLWRAALSSLLPSDRLEAVVSYVATGYCLTPGEISNIIQVTLTKTGLPPSALTGELLSETLCASKGQGLEGLADLRPTPIGLGDIILSDHTRGVIQDILGFARYSELVRDKWGLARMSPSSGLSVLFYGPPGTGKTLTAGVIAHELKRALYVVDISRIVDKYIGETEKRLARIFDHAQKSQAILLFDEADALFAKRTEVRNSNDRYANLEVNYLLQKLEAYRGVTILTTNLATSLDEALSRRIQFKLEFPMPSEKEREELWRILIPPKAPQGEIDFAKLAATFEMSGGHIKNAVFRACIHAATQNKPIHTKMLWDAALHEYKELGHIVRDIDHK